MSISSIVTIIIGALVAFVVPEWVKFGDKKNRSFVRLVINVIGILIIISGVISFIRAF